jgi:hypothetical protein
MAQDRSEGVTCSSGAEASNRAAGIDQTRDPVKISSNASRNARRKSPEPNAIRRVASK